MGNDRIKKILYISGSRSDFGLMKNILKAINNNSNFELEILVTGMHLMKEFGNSIEEIKKEQFKIHKVQAIYEKDDKKSMSNFIGTAIKEMTEQIHKIEPDLILLLGDRAEMLAGAIVGTYLSILVAHIHGGDVSSTVDESVRHAITKLSNIHFAATEKSGERIIRMGEKPSNVYVVGAPGIEQIVNSKLLSKEEIFKKYELNINKPFILCIQHPVTLEFKKAGFQIKETLNAIVDLEIQSIVIYPNADAGGRKMIEIIKKYNKNHDFIKAYKNLPRKDYLSLIKYSDVILGNSSSAIIESPSFKIPAINIGNRQKNREKTFNVIDVDYKKEEIRNGIEKALFDIQFKKSIEDLTTPYGEGNTSKKIIDIMSKIYLNDDILQKHLDY